MSVVNLLQSHRDRCLTFLGHAPGPGYDVIISPTKPASGVWLIEGRSPAGKAWLAKVHRGYNRAGSNQELQSIKANLQEWGLSFCTEWANVVTIRTDP